MPQPRIQLAASARQRLASRLDRLARELCTQLAAAAGGADPRRVALLADEIRAYALALLRARLGLLTPDAPTAPARNGAPPSLSRNGRNYHVTPATLRRFCELTGVSASHIGESGSNLTGIAFYFAMFALLTADEERPREDVRRLLNHLRETREKIDAFVVHWLHTSGWRCPAVSAGDGNHWLASLGTPPP